MKLIPGLQEAKTSGDGIEGPASPKKPKRGAGFVSTNPY